MEDQSQSKGLDPEQLAEFAKALKDYVSGIAPLLY